MAMIDYDKQIDEALAYFGPDYWSKIHPEALRSVALQLSLTYFDDQKFEYADNLCIAEISDTEAVETFKKSRAHGCCGRYDEIFWYETSDRRMLGYLIGFNYGH